MKKKKEEEKKKEIIHCLDVKSQRNFFFSLHFFSDVEPKNNLQQKYTHFIHE